MTSAKFRAISAESKPLFRLELKEKGQAMARHKIRACFAIQANAISRIKKGRNIQCSGLFERLAATYSRGSYTTTTIGHAVFDGRVRNGNGSDHRGNATKNFKKDRLRSGFGDSLKTTHRGKNVELFHNSRVEIADFTPKA
jgi:hypothetical protein